jgi:MFS family permease
LKGCEFNKMGNKAKLWTKDFLIISSTNLFIFLTFYLLVVTLSLFATERFDATQSEAGLASGIFVIGAVLARPFAGKWIDLIGRRKMLFIGLLFFLIGTLAYFFVNSLSLLIVIRLFHGMAFGTASNATGSIVADIIPNQRRGEGTGYFAMSTNLAMAMGPFIGLIISQHVGYQMVFAASAIFAICGLVACLFLRVPEAELTKKQRNAMKGFKLKDFYESSAVPISIVVGLVGFTYSSILTFLTPYAKEIGLLDVASFFFVVYAVFLIASRPFTGKLFDLKGENVIIYPCLILYAIGFLLLSQVEQGFFLLAAGALIGIGFGTFQSSAQAIAIKNAPKHRMGLATSTFYILYDTGIGMGPFLMGFLIPLTGFRGLYLVMVVLVACSIGLYFLLHGKRIAYEFKESKAS